MERANNLIETLANEYISLFFVDLNSGRMSIYRMDDRPYERSQPASANVLFQDYLEAFASDIREEFVQDILKYQDLSLIKKETQNKKSFTVNLRTATEDKDVSVRFIRAGYKDTSDFVVVGITDVTAQESILRKLELIEKLKEESDRANAAKTRFLSNMSHDIRTPMNAIVGYANIARTRKDDPKFLLSCIDNILKAGNHLQVLLNDILDMSRVESGKEELHAEEYSTLRLKEDAEAILGSMLEDKKLSLSFTADVKHRVFMIDVQKIRRITVNIVGNSIKFTPEGGTIKAYITEEPSDTEGYSVYTFEVSDNGIGMSEDFQKQLFELFSKERRTTDTVMGGTGLGMAITKRYVELMGGSIEVQSKQNVGTTIRIRLKLPYLDMSHNEFERRQDVQIASISLDDSLQDKRVLLVEDNKVNREMARMILEDMGLTVDCAGDGQEAVEKLSASEDNTYDYVLMDVQMPVLNGLEATRVIRASGRAYLQTVPIIALTANAFIEDINECLEAGMNAHVAKPFNVKEIKDTLTSF